ncbi:MAG: tyrosine--tRNA ligase [Gracilibacteraceae bacterium]|nr:tyrosine--tRNA ligase [Gracilibacteraceae bacterium]
MRENLFETLRERGYIYQCTHEEAVRQAVNNGPLTFYLGIDPTADSLHIGHFFALMLFRRLQEAGHRGILLVGGATAMVGDPSGKSDMRQMMDRERVALNIAEVTALARRFVRTEGDNAALIVNNADWTDSFSYIEFLRRVGMHFNVSVMLAADAYAKRLAEGGLTFLEMGYMLMQAYDFVHLYENYGCTLQIGGSDQWGNIVAGVNLGRKMRFGAGGREAESDVLRGLTCPLLMTRDGKKMGKTEQGTLWVAREKTAVFDFFQYFYNVDDSDTEMLLKLFTDMETAEAERLCREDAVAAKRRMAYEITKLVHGAAEADKTVQALQALYGGTGTAADMPTAVLRVPAGQIGIVELLTESGFLPSRGEARRLISQGGVSVNDGRVQTEDAVIDAAAGTEVVLKKGKKSFLRVQFEVEVKK